MLRQDDYQKAQLVTAGYTYGKEYGGHLAACLIMSCLANRQRCGWGTWLDIIQNIYKFSATIEQPKFEFPSIWEASFVRLLHEVDAIYDGSQDHSKGGLYWCDLRNVNSPFFKEKIIAMPEIHPRIVEMNSLALFK